MENIYVVIFSWTDLDPTKENFGKTKWDIISSEPTTFENANEIKNIKRESWITEQLSKPVDEQNFTNVESVITIDYLENILKKEI
jgi:hypothetical protein